jgi:hypothetical protein
VMVTDIKETHRAINAAVARMGADRVLVPALLGMSPMRKGLDK